jgi:hypothetical protein
MISKTRKAWMFEWDKSWSVALANDKLSCRRAFSLELTKRSVVSRYNAFQ